MVREEAILGPLCGVITALHETLKWLHIEKENARGIEISDYVQNDLDQGYPRLWLQYNSMAAALGENLFRHLDGV
jgi:hypothetical protein